MSKKVHTNKEEILHAFRLKILQAFRVKQTRDYFDSKRKDIGLKSEEEYSSLRITYSCIDFTHSMLFARLFDDDASSFSIKNIVKALDEKKKINWESYFLKNSNAIKALAIWRGNVFAHDNFDVTISSRNFTSDDIFTHHFLDYYFKDLMDMLIAIYTNCEHLYGQRKTIDELLNELSLEIEERRVRYQKSLENSLI